MMTAPGSVSALRRRRYAERHGVAGGPCPYCGEPREAESFVYYQHGKRLQAGVRCHVCRAAETHAPVQKGGAADYMAAAERVLYPGVPYHAMTPTQRRHCYWLARTWVLATDLPQTWQTYDPEMAQQQLAVVGTWLTARGVSLTPIPLCPLPSR
jgi:hypothetical protein